MFNTLSSFEIHYVLKFFERSSRDKEEYVSLKNSISPVVLKLDVSFTRVLRDLQLKMEKHLV